MTDVRQIRRARAADHDTLVALWERSVRATHEFLTETDIGALRPLVREVWGTQTRFTRRRGIRG
jgi:hypothetical protein